MRMRQGLCYLGVRRGPRSHLLDGKKRFDQFRTWLRHRTHVNAAQTIPRGSTNVFTGVNMPALSRTASRLCKAPPLFVEDFVTWCTKPLFHGIYVCPDYVHGSTATYAQPIWSRGDQWHACAEQDREVFYIKEGQIFYAGTYVCHTGPGQLRIHHLGKIGSEAIDQLVRITHKGGDVPAERDAVRDLYIEGTLTVHVLGLERIGFNAALHQDLTSSLWIQTAQGSSSETAKAPLSKKQRKRARAAAAAGLQHPLPPQPAPAPYAPAPGPSRGPFIHPSRMAYNATFYDPYLPMNLPAPPFPQYPVPSHIHVGRPSHALPPRPIPFQAPRAPSEIEYADEDAYGDQKQYDGYDEYGRHVKREREEDGYDERDDGQAHKVPKLEDELEEERWVEAEIRPPSQASELHAHPGVYLEDEVYYGWKDEY
ncbi:hypothetical protein C8Q80DRAFT_1267872 [Daedaleopsis nitida]|nr:hypothetical protein C8Q80DRAFT_1267872 [Daedaleopsis nitida]